MGRLLVSPQLGIIHDLRVRRSDDDGHRVTDYVASVAGFGSAEDEVRTVYGGGSRSRAHAAAAAIGEAVERYSLSVYDPAALLWAHPGELAGASFGVDELTWFVDAQYADPAFPFRRPAAEWTFAWARGYSVRTRTEAFVPASLVYLPYRLCLGENATTYPVSSGTSCARSAAEAACRALLELVERDALTICWEHHVPYPAIDATEVAAAASPFGEAAARVRVVAFELTTDVDIPVVLSLVLSERDRPALAVGAAADLDPTAALHRAVEEAITSWRSASYACRNDRAAERTLMQRMGTTNSFLEHSLYYAQPEHLVHFDFLLRSPLRARSFAPARPHAAGGSQEDAVLRLSACVERLCAAGHDAVLFDLTPSDVESVGLHVVRAVSPTLVRQTIGLAARHLANPRILEVPRRLGHVKAPRSIDDILCTRHPAP